MNVHLQRRGFLAQSIGVAAASALALGPQPALATGEVERRGGVRIKIGLNSYSFNRDLLSGQMTLDQLIDYCAQNDIDGVDTTGYYFPGYPDPPKDEYLYALKKKAYVNGVTISGTGVRNDFTLEDGSSRRGHIELVKDWINVGEKIGAPVVRVFSGPGIPKGSTFEKVLAYMIPAFQECCEYGKKHGVMIGLQHHDDFLKTADQVIQVVKAVNSEWFGIVLDVGSFRQNDVYAEIEKTLPYAITWQIKSHVYADGKSAPIDLPRLRKIIERVGFRGYLPVELLGGGSREAVTAFLDQVRKAMA